jgi:hypothetical protein
MSKVGMGEGAAEKLLGASAATEELRQRSEAAEKRHKLSVARGLMVLAVLALLASIARAGLERVFVHGWWRQW